MNEHRSRLFVKGSSRWQVLLLFALIAAHGQSVSVSEVAQHKGWMDSAQDLSYDLKDALDAKSSEKAAEPAEKLIQLGVQVDAFWKKTKLDDIVELAQQNLKLSRQIAAEARGGGFDLATANYEKLQANCRSCHDLHPEKRWKVRQ